MSAAPKKGFGQIASALQRAGIVAFIPEQERLIADVRSWLIRLVMQDDVLPADAMTKGKPHKACWEIANRLAQSGFLQTIKRGQGRTRTESGFAATQQLIDMGREGATDEWVASFIWPKQSEPVPSTPSASEPETPSVPEPTPQPGASLRDRILADVQVWLARLRAGEVVGADRMTELISEHRRGEFSRRLREDGLTEIKMGHTGGSKALPALIEMGPPSNDWIADRLFASSEPDPVYERTREAPPWRPDRHVPKSIAAREAKAVSDVREWLKQAARGGRMRGAHLTSTVHGTTARAIAARLCDAGIVAKHGEPHQSWYEIVGDKADAVNDMTDEQIATYIWPSRFAPEVPEMSDTSEPEPEVELQGRRAEDHVLSIVAERWDQILAVLERMDARFARLERELSLPPIESVPVMHCRGPECVNSGGCVCNCVGCRGVRAAEHGGGQ